MANKNRNKHPRITNRQAPVMHRNRVKRQRQEKICLRQAQKHAKNQTDLPPGQNMEPIKAMFSKDEKKVPEYAPPRTIEEAVDFLMKGLSLKDKVIISRLPFDDLFELYPTLGQFIRNDFRLWTGNDELLESCQSTSADDASAIIIEALWNRLRETHQLRKVK